MKNSGLEWNQYMGPKSGNEGQEELLRVGCIHYIIRGPNSALNTVLGVKYFLTSVHRANVLYI